MASRVRWRGPEVARAVSRAAADAIDETTREAAEEARSSHWWQSRSGILESEIVAEPARVENGRLVGRFGTTRTRGFYGLFLEKRTPFLRPAADRAFPNLARRMRGRLRW